MDLMEDETPAAPMMGMDAMMGSPTAAPSGMDAFGSMEPPAPAAPSGMDAFGSMEPPAPAINGGMNGTPEPEGPNRQREWEVNHEVELEALARQEIEEKKGTRETAAGSLKEWHDEEDSKLKKKKELNRTTEQEFHKFQAEQNGASKSWDRVMSLVEGATLMTDGKDVARMKKLFYSLKATPKA